MAVRPGNIDRFDVFVPVTCMIELNLKTEKFLLSGRFPPYIYLLLSPHPCDEHIRVVVFSSPTVSFSSPPSSAPPGLGKSGSSALPVRQNDPFFEAILYNSHLVDVFSLFCRRRCTQSSGAKTFQGNFSPSDSRVSEVLLGTIITTLLASIFVVVRLYTRTCITGNWGWDDTLITIAWVISESFFTPPSILKTNYISSLGLTVRSCLFTEFGTGHHQVFATISDIVPSMKLAFASRISTNLSFASQSCQYALFT